MSYTDPKAAFDAESDDHDQQKSRAVSMLSGGGSSGSDGGFIDEPLVAADAPVESRGIMSHTTLLIAVVAVVAAGSLYAMRLTQRAAAAPGAGNAKLEASLENWIAKLSSPEKVDPNDPMHPDNIQALFSDTEEVLRVLSLDSAEQQVPIEFVKQNPFLFSPNGQAAVAPISINDDAAAFDRARLLRRQQMEVALSKYSVDSIMLGSRKVAIISGEMYQVGDRLGDFRIDDIQAMQINLSNGQEKFVLSLDMTSAAPPRKKR